MSGVLSIDDAYVTTAEGKDISSVCNALLAKAKESAHTVDNVTLVFPLDGRHNLAHIVLEEANRRGWQYARHLPRGLESQLLDLQGADAAPELEASNVPALIETLTQEIQSAIEDSELAEALAVLRQILAIGIVHFGAWHPDTYWALSNLIRFAAATGADANIDQAAGLLEHLLEQPLPAELDNPLGLLRKLDETAKNCAQCGRSELATHVMDAALNVARKAFGEEHPNFLAMQNNACLLLSAIKSPQAEPALRALLQSARKIMGEKHPNIAVVLSNLAELLESQGRAEEAAPLRKEAQSIRNAASP